MNYPPIFMIGSYLLSYTQIWNVCRQHCEKCLMHRFLLVQARAHQPPTSPNLEYSFHHYKDLLMGDWHFATLM